jgi:hypothetical protein
MVVSVKESSSLEPCSVFYYRLRTSSVLGRRIATSVYQRCIIAGVLREIKSHLVESFVQLSYFYINVPKSKAFS